MINGYSGPNRWLTPIQAALRITKDSQPQTAYLSHECRAEQIPVIHNTPRIFNSVYEFVVLQGFTETHVFRAGMNAPLMDKLFGVPPRSHKWDVESKVLCKEVEIEPFSFEEIFEQLTDERINAKDLYMKVSWNEGGGRTS